MNKSFDNNINHPSSSYSNYTYSNRLREASNASNNTAFSMFDTGEPVRVVVRIRPLIQHEQNKGICCAVSSDTNIDCETSTGRKS